MRGTRRELPILTERINPEPISSYTFVRPTPISSATSSGRSKSLSAIFPPFVHSCAWERIDHVSGAVAFDRPIEPTSAHRQESVQNERERRRRCCLTAPLNAATSG